MENTAEKLKQAVFERLDEYRVRLSVGDVDMTQVQDIVRDYCDLLATLPRAEQTAHKEALEEMMRQLGELGDRLRAERDEIRAQLDGLGRLRRANVAYQTSDWVGKKPPKEEP